MGEFSPCSSRPERRCCARLGRGRRSARRPYHSSNKFVYDGWNLVAELNATNNALVRSYAWGLDLSGSMGEAGLARQSGTTAAGVGGLLWINDSSTLNSQPSTHLVSYDGNGNVTALVDAGSGNETARYEYGPFGDLTQASGLMARANPIRFSSKYHDDATGLIYYGYRYYSPTFQRWLNRDPLGEEGGLNLYGLNGNDLINSVDPLGLDTDWTALERTHNFPQQFEEQFWKMGINVHAEKNITLMPAWAHRAEGIGIHSQGYNDAWRNFFYDSQGRPIARTADDARTYFEHLKHSETYKPYFDIGKPAAGNYPGFQRVASKIAKGLSILGVIALVASSEALAQDVIRDVRMFSEDCARGEDDWAYVDLLSMRQSLNQQAFFSGDVAMRGFLQKMNECGCKR